VPAAGTGKEDDYCTLPAHCDSGVCLANACTALLDLRESCASGGNERCASGYCDAGWGSGNTNTCVPAAGTGIDGEYCTTTNHCSRYSFCDGDTCRRKIDVPVDSVGDASIYRCTHNSQCMSNYCDYPRNARCYPAQNEGGPGHFCVNSFNCWVGRQCVMVPGHTYGFCN
jgi:hypothetical protein